MFIPNSCLLKQAGVRYNCKGKLWKAGRVGACRRRRGMGEGAPLGRSDVIWLGNLQVRGE